MGCKSMTGFGRAQIDGDFASVTVELKTVNHRFCEWSLRLPRELLGLEADIRAYLASRIERGRGDLYLTIQSTAADLSHVGVNWSALDGLRQHYSTAAERYGFEADLGTAVIQWMTMPDVIHVEPPVLQLDTIRSDVMTALEAAVVGLLEGRAREGQRIAADLDTKLSDLNALVERIQVYAHEASLQNEQRLRGRVAEFVGGVDEPRLLTEIVIALDKMSVDEELVRFSSHLAEFRSTLAASRPVGRRLDFLVQEMHREVNTIGSKANHLEIAKAVVDAKVIVEQLREQTQNLE